MKLEAVNIQNFSELCPATVTKVVNDYHFLVTIDTYLNDQVTDSVLCCNSNTPYIFPIKWAEEHELELETPKGKSISIILAIKLN